LKPVGQSKFDSDVLREEVRDLLESVFFGGHEVEGMLKPDANRFEFFGFGVTQDLAAAVREAELDVEDRVVDLLLDFKQFVEIVLQAFLGIPGGVFVEQQQDV